MKNNEEIISERELDEFDRRIEEERKEKEKQAEKNGAIFHIANQKIVFTREELDLINVINRARSVTEKVKTEFQLHYNREVKTFANYIDQDEYIRDHFVYVLKKLSILSSNSHEKCTTDDIGEEFERLNGGTTLLLSRKNLRICFEEEQKLENQLREVGDSLELQKACRNRVTGYGTGISGMLRASIASSLINAGIGGAYDIRNGYKISKLKNKCIATLNDFVKNPKTKEILFSDFNKDMDNLLQAYVNVLYRKQNIHNPAFNIDCSYEEVEEAWEQSDRLFGMNDNETYVFMLQLYPWNENLYDEILKEYGDKNNDLSRYAKLFNMDIVDRRKKEKEDAEKRRILEKKRKEEERKRQNAIEEARKKKEKLDRLRRERDELIKRKKEIDYRSSLESQLENVNIPDEIYDEYNKLEKKTQTYYDKFSQVKKSIQDSIEEIGKLEKEKNNLQQELNSLGIFALQKKKNLKVGIDNITWEVEEKKKSLDTLRHEESLTRTRYNDAIVQRDKVIPQYEEQEKKKIMEELNKYYALHVPSFKMIDNNEVMFGKKRWKILEHEGSCFLLIEKSLLPVPRPYEESKNETDWNSCSLRKWLNSEYYFGFEEEERKIISKSSLENSEDFVFLLSEDEVRKYFKENQSRTCDINKRNQKWWLRSLGEPKTVTNIVGTNGEICTEGEINNSSNIYVRPMVKIDFSCIYDDNRVLSKYKKLCGNEENEKANKDVNDLKVD